MLERSVSKKISIKVDLRATNSIVYGDPSSLQNALLNLGVNARDAMPQGGTLLFSTSNITGNEMLLAQNEGSLNQDVIEISVKDTGLGMEASLIDRIFEPFFTTKEVGKGTGMGLAASYGTITQHSGDISVTSAPGIGTTFTIRLPTAGLDVPASDPQKLDIAPLKNKNILVVDDEPTLRELGAEILRKAHCRVRTATDGLHALDILGASDHEVDLILLDIVMPEMDGIEALQEILNAYPNVKVITMSGNAPNISEEEILEKGAKAFLQKPFMENELYATVLRVLD